MQIEEVLKNLSVHKPYFKSEKEFQLTLSNQIEKVGLITGVNSSYLGQKVDILVKDPNKNDISHAIQLRHKTAYLSMHDGSIVLKNHGAQDQARYDFIKDIKSLENIKKGDKNVKGYAIILSNDPKYWQHPTKLNSVDEDFLIYEGKLLYGNLKWSPHASLGTKLKREENIELSNEYKCIWGSYSSINLKGNNVFRYLVVEI